MNHNDPKLVESALKFVPEAERGMAMAIISTIAIQLPGIIITFANDLAAVKEGRLTHEACNQLMAAQLEQKLYEGIKAFVDLSPNNVR